MAEFHDRLFYMRNKRNFTQDELGLKTNLTGATISMLENGIRKPSYDTLKSLAVALTVSLDYLVFGRGAPLVEKGNRKP